MTHAVKVYKDGIFLGDGTGTAASANVTSYTGADPQNGRNVQVTCVAGANATGRTYNARVVSGSGTGTLTMFHADPFGD